MNPEAILLTVEQAAAIVGVSPWTIRKWRTKGQGPRFVRLGGALGTVRYRRKDLDDFLEASVVDPAT